MPKILDQALDHIVENLPGVISERLTIHMLDYLIQNREKILEQATKKKRQT
jgi:hypothetical protein